MAGDFQPYREARTEFAFHWLPTGQLSWLVFIGFIALLSGRTLLPGVLGFLGVSVFARALSWSGPYSMARDVVSPLIGIQNNLSMALFGFNMIFLFICVAKLQAGGAWPGRKKVASPRPTLSHN